MKLLALLILLSFNAIAQLPGYYPEFGYAYDNFGSSLPYPNLEWPNQGSQPITTDSLHSGENCILKKTTYSYNVLRDPINKNGFVTVNQPYASFAPLEFNFGKNAMGRKNVLDLSKGNALLSFKIKNTTGHQLVLHVTIVDSTGKKIIVIAKDKQYYNFLNRLMYYLNSGEEFNQTINFNKNGADLILPANPCLLNEYKGVDSTFNKKIVYGVSFAFVNSFNNQNDFYRPLQLKNGTVEFYQVKVGSSSIVTGYDGDNIGDDIKIFPNPSNGTLHFSKMLENIILTDLAGNPIMNVKYSSSLNLENLNKGVYFIHSSSISNPRKILVQ